MSTNNLVFQFREGQESIEKLFLDGGHLWLCKFSLLTRIPLNPPAIVGSNVYGPKLEEKKDRKLWSEKGMLPVELACI